MSVSGKYMRGRIGSTVITGFVKGDMSGKADELDATTAENDGISTDTDAGLTTRDFMLSGIHDPTGAGPFPALLAGTILTNFKLYMQSPSASPLTGPVWTLASAVILEDGHQVNVRGRIEWSCKIRNKGAVTYAAS